MNDFFLYQNPLFWPFKFYCTVYLFNSTYILEISDLGFKNFIADFRPYKNYKFNGKTRGKGCYSSRKKKRNATHHTTLHSTINVCLFFLEYKYTEIWNLLHFVSKTVNCFHVETKKIWQWALQLPKNKDCYLNYEC